MGRSTAFGPQLSRMLLEQRLNSQAGRYNERRAVALAGGARRWRRWGAQDTAAGQRASAAFGLTGGELCGCHAAECGTCASNWGCGVADCGVCAARGWRTPGPKRKPGAEADGLGGPVDERVFGPMVDSHSHLFVPGPFATSLSATKWTKVDDCVGWLKLAKHAGCVERMVISGMRSGRRGIFPDGHVLDDAVQRAVTTEPDYFIPLVRGFNWMDDDTYTHRLDADAGEYAESWLEAGFAGVGEVFVHGHRADADDLEPLVDVCCVAARYGVPVQVHWEIGNVDRWNDPNGYHEGTSASYNFARLKWLLNEVKSRGGTDVTLILAHCGIGPALDQNTPPDTLTNWQGRVTELLEDFSNVYFDIAGMIVQLTEKCHPEEPNDQGKFILDCIHDNIHRFMLGIDTETKSLDDYLVGTTVVRGVKSWLATVADYRNFLGSDYARSTLALSDTALRMILRENAERLFRIGP